MKERVGGAEGFPEEYERLRPRRRLSQNFLADRGIAQRIVAAFAPAATDHVLEVGPGRGALTDLVAGRVARLVTVELDTALAAALERRMGAVPGVEVVRGDILRLRLGELRTGPRLRLLANLPYGISSPMLLKILDEVDAVAGALLMLQHEFAVRVAAAPGGRDYGSLSALVQARLRAERLFDVPPAAFRPRPSVVSTVVRLLPLERPLVPPQEWATYRRLLRVAFSGRRKTLANALARGLALSRPQAIALLTAAGLDPLARAETVPPEGWAGLAHAVETAAPAGDI